MALNTKRAPKRSKVQASKPSLAFGGAVHASIRNRWQSERPFLGHSESSLIRKLRSDAVLDYTKDLIYKELYSRGFIEIDETTGKISARSLSKLIARYANRGDHLSIDNRLNYRAGPYGKLSEASG